MVTAEAGSIAGRLVSLSKSAVAESSAATYESARRCFTRFCLDALGLPEGEAPPNPRQPGADLNVELVRLFVADSVGKLAASTVTGTVSALADWQRFKGVAPERFVRRDVVAVVGCSGADATRAGRCSRSKTHH
jgi:hypothetical protein